MVNAKRPETFHERFNIDVGTKEAQRRFVNRVDNEIFSVFLPRRIRGDFVIDYEVTRETLRIDVANALGERYPQRGIADFVKGDFLRCLQALETIYEKLEDTSLDEDFTQIIERLVNTSEVDLGVAWQPPIFVRAGALLLDQHLVNEPLRWLSDPKYRTVYEPFEKGMNHYLRDNLPDVITDMYESVEALAKIVTGRSSKDLSGNAEMFISKARASQHYKDLLKTYIAYANEFRHAEREGRPRPPLSEPEVESFIYLTGLFIRLAIRTT